MRGRKFCGHDSMVSHQCPVKKRSCEHIGLLFYISRHSTDDGFVESMDSAWASKSVGMTLEIATYYGGHSC